MEFNSGFKGLNVTEMTCTNLHDGSSISLRYEQQSLLSTWPEYLAGISKKKNHAVWFITMASNLVW